MTDFIYHRAEDEFPGFLPGKGNEPEEAEFILESAAADEDGVVSHSENTNRAKGMTAALEWVAGEDFTYKALDDIVYGMADLDEDGDISDDEEEEYNELLLATGNALVFLGGNSSNVTSAMDKEDDDAALKLGGHLKTKLDATEESDGEMIRRFTSPKDMITEAVKKVVRGGKVMFVKKKLKRKRLSAAQRAGLKKARRKANSAAARFARKKSMRMRKSRGM